MAPRGEDSPPGEFDDYIRKLRKTDEVPRSERAAYIANEILEETGGDGSLRVSLVDSFIASIQRVRAADRQPIVLWYGGDKVILPIVTQDIRVGALFNKRVWPGLHSAFLI